MIKIIAVLCSLASPGNCHEQAVTTSDFADVSIQSCLMGAPRTGTALFPVNMKTICIGYWKRSSSAAINNCHNVRIIAASQFTQHEQETPDVRVLFTPH